ncbi:MAG: carbohydrate-binding protein [Marinoscillum sp.]
MKISNIHIIIAKAIFYLIPFTLVYGVTAQEISPRLVGNNAWYTNPTDEVWALTGECGVQTIRIGGNGFNDNMPSNATLLNWVEKIRGIGAEPIIQVSQHQSAEAAAAVVRFFNVEMAGEIEPVRFWNIGNEPWLEANRPPTSEVGALVEAYYKPRAEAMKEVDPSIKIYGPDFAYYIEDALDDLFGGPNDIAGKIPGKDYYYCDGLSWHRYPQDDNINLAYEGLEDFRESIVKCKAKVDAINASYNRTGGEALQWGIGEYNAKGGSVVHTWENGQMFGGILGLCMKYEADYAATWSMFENGGNRQGTDFSFIDGENMTPRSSYRHMQFVAQNFSGTYIDGSSSNEHVIVYGAQDKGKTAVMIMNRESGRPLKYALHLNTASNSGDDVILKVDGKLEESYADIIGEKTTHVLVFQGDSVVKHNYSSYHFDNQLPPVETILADVTALPDMPTQLEGTSPAYDRIMLAWTDNSTNEAGFIIEKKINDDFEIVSLVDSNVTSFMDAELTASTTYEYRVLAYNALGESDYTGAVSVTTAEAPAQVTFNGPHVIPGKIQVEDFNEGGQGISYYDLEEENRGGQYRTGEWVDLEASTDEEGGFNIGYVTDGEWLNYNISEVNAGEYVIAIRQASNSTENNVKHIHVSLGSELIGTLTPQITGGWQEWTTLYLENVMLDSSTDQVLQLAFEGSGFNINWIDFVEVIPTKSPIKEMGINLFNNPANKVLEISLDKEVNSLTLQVYNLSGQVFLEKQKARFSNGTFSTANFPKGIYVVKIIADRQTLNQKVFIN